MSTRKLKYGAINLKGQKVGNLLVLKAANGKKRKWKCRCLADDCGRVITVAHNRLIDKNNPKTHCGCLRGGLPKKYPKEYHAWWDAKNRCHNPEHPSYPSYGAKGITMCERWRESFAAFLEDVGPRPSKGHSLDRVDPFGPYALHHPETKKVQVRWATLKVQARNKKGTKWIKHPKTGETVAAAAYAEEIGVKYQVMREQMIIDGTWFNYVKPPKDR